MNINDLMKQKGKLKSETLISKKGGKIMNKTKMFNKVVSLVIALMMLIPSLPSSLVGAEEQLDIVNDGQDIIAPVTSGSAISGEISFTVEHYLQNEDGTYPETTDEVESKSTTDLVVYDGDYDKEFEGWTFLSDIDNSSTVEMDGSIVLRLYYEMNKDNLTLMSAFVLSTNYISASDVMTASGQSTNNHLTGKYAWISPTGDIYVAFSVSGPAYDKTLVNLSYHNVPLFNNDLSEYPIYGTDYEYMTELIINGSSKGMSNWLVVNYGKKNFENPFYAGLDYSENGFDAWGNKEIKVVISEKTVTYNANGGTGTTTDDNNPYGYNEEVTVLPNRFDYAGHYFVQWTTTIDGIAKEYDPNEKFFMPNSNVVLYAQWSLIPQAAYKVEHYKQDLNAPTYMIFETENLTGTTNTTATASPKTYTGYTYDSGIAGTIASGTIAGDGSLVLKLYYKKNYEIKYEAGANGSLTGGNRTDNKFYGDSFDTEPTPVANAGYSFNNWTPALPGTSDTVTENKTFTANFKENANVIINYKATTGGTVSKASETLAPATGVAVGSTASASTGYTFVNWTNEENVEVSTALSFIPSKVNGLNVAATYTANFKENANVTINYKATTGGTVSKASETLAPATGVAVGSTASASTGYTFVNWTNEENVEVSTALSFIPSKVNGLNVAATYTANFKENANVTINYKATTGGTVSRASETLAPATGVAVGSTASATTGYTFVNWTNEENVEVSTALSFIPSKVNGLNVAATYTANFKENANVTINYKATTGGTVSKASETLAPATGVALGSTATASTGYTFVNWTDEENVEVSTALSFIPSKVNGLNVAATYTANFKENANVTINYKATTGGTVSRASETLAPATGVAVGSTASATTGYTFVNWTNEENVEVSTALSFIPSKVNGLNVAATYTANFKENANVTINYKATTGGTVSKASETLAPATGVALGSTATASAGYTFVNWTDEENVEVSTALSFIPAMVNGLNVAATYTANFEENDDVIINYEATTGGTVSRASETLAPATGVALGSTATASAGYTFVNWTDEENVEVSTALSFIPAMVNGLNIAATYTANFEENDDVIINYEATTGGTVSRASETLAPATGVALGSTATASTGYTFVNWTDEENVEVSTALSFIPAMVNGLNVAATYTANFEENDDVIINYEATTGGTVSRASETLAPATGVALGSTATASAGYTFVNWTDEENVEVSTALSFIPAMVNGLNVEATYTANFEENDDVIINYEATTGGTVSRASETLAPATGVALGSTATASAGYTFVNWTDEENVEVSTALSFIPAMVNGLNVAATYTANFVISTETIDINVYKNWADDMQAESEVYIMLTESVKPNIIIRLFANKIEVNNVTLKDGETYYSFENKRKYDEFGEIIEYTVTEDLVTGYESYVESYEDGDIYVYITNTLQEFNVNYDPNTGTGTAPTEQIYTYGDSVTVLSNTMFSKSNYRFTGWNTAADGTGTAYAELATFKMPAENVTLYAQWNKKSKPRPPVIIDDPEVPLAELEKLDHFAYVIGYVEGDVRPENNITREEVAMIFYRLLTDESRNELLSDSNPFTDIDSSRWSNRAISTLYNGGILKGYLDGEFKPSDPISRAEFAAISARFDKLEPISESELKDITGHWAEKYINSSELKGWIKGYEDNTFRPEIDITRAESMTLINNVLGRGVLEENIHPDAIIWPDNLKTAWYYEAVEEATNSHDYIRDEKNLELWTGMKANKVWP